MFWRLVIKMAKPGVISNHLWCHYENLLLNFQWQNQIWPLTQYGCCLALAIDFWEVVIRILWNLVCSCFEDYWYSWRNWISCAIQYYHHFDLNLYTEDLLLDFHETWYPRVITCCNLDHKINMANALSCLLTFKKIMVVSLWNLACRCFAGYW